MKKIKIVARVFGGLGNQLFCYAAARRLAIINNSELIIDNISGFNRDFEYNRKYQLDHFHIPCKKALPSERLEPFSRFQRIIKRRINTYIPFENRRYIKQEGVDFDNRLIELRLKNSIYLEGYWQSENYFKDIKEILIKELEIIPPVDPINLTMAKEINSNMSVAIHVRFFDMSTDKNTNNTPSSYYKHAIKKMELIVPNAHYYVFSDDPKTAKNIISLDDKRVTFVTQNQSDLFAYADLWLMAQCQHFIIANSTFSWWGAWLSKNPNKQIIAPVFGDRTLSASWGFKGLLPETWHKL